MGWVLEFFFRRFVSMKRWVNPGFLVGPFIPLYGFGLVGLYLLTLPDYTFAGAISQSGGIILQIIFEGLTMTVVEFIAGLFFVKVMKVSLWDYSSRWGNIMGIICPLFSLIWTILGGLYSFFLNDHLVQFARYVFDFEWFGHFILGIGYGILLVDVFYSFQLTAKMKKALQGSKVIIEWERAKSSFAQSRKSLQRKAHWLIAFYDDSSFGIMMNKYIEKALFAQAKRSHDKKISKARREMKRRMRKNG